MSLYAVGLTGGLASGKSTAGERFAKLGALVIDADQVARAVVEPGSPALARIAARHGEHILTAEGELKRRDLRERIFADPSERAWLENLLHPLINREIQRRLGEAEAAGEAPYATLVSPLLFETGQAAMTERTLVIDCDEAQQIERAMRRDGYGDPAQVRAIIETQMTREERLRRADDVLVNDGDPALLRAKVDQLHRSYLQRAATRR